MDKPKPRFSFRDAPQLRPFVLRRARRTDRKIGDGSYGTVEELEVDGLRCAGKRLHDVLVERTNQGVSNILSGFVDECTLLADLRHPHIVQFLGICFLRESDLPVLVMEYLPYCLDSFLDPGEGSRIDFPLAVKCSILVDVARGLTSLHAQVPAIIHRDLTAKNVLLTAAMTAKIADLGVARILKLRPGRLAATMTQTPGTLAYMPPEAMEEVPQYNATIDMFSFGHLTLYTLAQDFPYPTAPTRPDPYNPGMVIGLTEVQRRSRQVEQLSQELGGERHPLVQLVTQCLHNNPRRRPSARQVLSQLEEIKAQVEDPYEHMSKLELIQALRSREREAIQATQLETELHAKKVALEASQVESQRLQEQLQASQAEARMYRSKVEQLQTQLEAKGKKTRVLESQQSRIRAESDPQVPDRPPPPVPRRQLSKKPPAPPPRVLSVKGPPRTFNWRQGKDMLFGTDSACAVVLDGKVYIGGGQAPSSQEHFIVQVYVSEDDEWTSLPECPVKLFAMAVVNQQLVLVGGCDHNDCDQATVVAWKDASQRWTQPYPNMPTARTAAAAVSYQQYLVVAGGNGEASALNTVEILNSSTKQWLIGVPLPSKGHFLTPALVGDTLYLLGGWLVSPNKQMFSISLPKLVSHATSAARAPRWTVTPISLKNSTCVSINNSLLAVGGENNSDERSLAICLYDPETRQWNKAGELPTPLAVCACAALPSGQLVVMGGKGEYGYNCSQAVYFTAVNRC